MLLEEKKVNDTPEEEPVKEEPVETPKEETAEAEAVEAEVAETEVVEAEVVEAEVVQEPVADDGDSDFSDEVKAPEPVKEEPKPATEGEEPGVSLYADETDIAKVQEPEAETEVVKDAKGKDVVQYVYKDERLKGIETARDTFNRAYKKTNRIKWIVALVGIIVVIAGWIIPNSISSIQSNTSLAFGITLGVAALGLAGILVYSSIAKKKNQQAMDVYFNDYYRLNNEYVFGDKVENLQGGVKEKLDAELFKACNIYSDVYKVGSRDCLSFELDGKPIVYSDAAAQVKGKKSLRTVFVGKFIAFDNNWKGGDILIYFKGNKRALPPTNLEGREVYSDKKNLVIYGGSATKKFLTKSVRETLSKFSMNATLVDLTISVREGKTYVCMGYEDTLMVLPMDKPFNPAPTEQLASDTDKLFAFIRATWGRHENNG